jgi:DNA-binding NarL/FixJ family response regulator
MTIRLLVADDQELVRAGFSAVLATQPDFEVVGEAADGREAVDGARRHHPHVVLMDVRMPNLDGIAATAEICAGRPAATRVLILTTFDLDEYVMAALRAGASGFLLKDAPRDSLYAAVRTVAAGDALLALKVNGEDLSMDHGFPARVIVPALPGVHNTKWVGQMTFRAA